MRDLMLLGAMLLLVWLAFKHVVVAYLIWGWTAFVGVNYYMYGFMGAVPFNQIFALITLCLLFVGRDAAKGSIAPSATVILMLLFFAQCSLSALCAYPGLVRNGELYTNVLKIMVFCLIMPLVITTRERLHAFVVAIVLGTAIHGVLEGLKTVVTFGGHHVAGQAKFGDNNHFAIVLLMALPLLFYLYLHLSRGIAKHAALWAMLLTLAAIIGTGSRGALLAMMAVGLWALIHSRRKVATVATLSAVVALVLVLAPASWFERMDSITTAGEDSSFMARVGAWKISSAIALENPLTGGGFRALQDTAVWANFSTSQGLLWFVDTPVARARPLAAHSIYFEVLGDLGFIGLFLFLGILTSAFINRQRIVHTLKSVGCTEHWAIDLANLVSAALIAYMVGAALLSLAYYEIMYVFVMLMDVIRRIVENSVNQIFPSSDVPNRKRTYA